MATFWLVNNVQVGTTRMFAGSRVDTATDNVAGIQAAGGVLFPTGTASVDAAAADAQALHLRGGDPDDMEGIMNAAVDAAALVSGVQVADLASVAAGKGASMVGVQDAAARFAGTTTEAVFADLGARIALAFANAAAQTAYPATARANGQIVALLDDYSVWQFDAASAAGASDYVRVPDAGTGRWLRKIPTLAELASVANAKGASLLGVEDAAAILVATTQEGVNAELRAQEAGSLISSATPLVGTDVAKKGELRQFDPTLGAVILQAPAAPSLGWKFGGKNATTDVTGWTADGNGKNIEHPNTGVLAATAVGISGARTCVVWEYDGVQWTVINAFNIV